MKEREVLVIGAVDKLPVELSYRQRIEASAVDFLRKATLMARPMYDALAESDEEVKAVFFSASEVSEYDKVVRSFVSDADLQRVAGDLRTNFDALLAGGSDNSLAQFDEHIGHEVINMLALGRGWIDQLNRVPGELARVLSR